MFNDLSTFGLATDPTVFRRSALNAIQRRYPQVYKSNDILLLKPETIGVGLGDFMISIKSNDFFFQS